MGFLQPVYVTLVAAVVLNLVSHNIMIKAVSCRSSSAVMEALVQLISEENSVSEVK